MGKNYEIVVLLVLGLTCQNLSISSDRICFRVNVKIWKCIIELDVQFCQAINIASSLHPLFLIVLHCNTSFFGSLQPYTQLTNQAISHKIDH
jgi:hypothetical protein